MPESSRDRSFRALELLAYKLPLRPGRETREDRSRSMLLRALDQGTAVAFIGSGISRPFGYPSWTGLSLEVLRRTVRALEQADHVAPGSLEYITELREGARRIGKKLPPNALMFMIGACKKVLAQNDLSLVYDSLFEKRFAQAPRSNCEAHVFQALLAMPIQRFVTTNYDCEIERALARFRQGAVTPKDFGLGSKQDRPDRKGRLSFTQHTENLGRLALFALAGARGNENMVFHCHGRFDDPASIIATEADYQQWYLGQEDGAFRSFQQSIEFLLGSNPLLFIGYSLSDEDLLHPLRQLGVLDPTRKDSRPIFALLKCSAKNPEVDRYHHDALFERYGLHVISYPLGEKPDNETDALRRELVQIQDDLKAAHRRWSQKPFLKRPERRPDDSEPYCEIQDATEVPVKRLDRLEDEVHRPGILVLTGPSGAGKSLHAIRLARDSGFPKAFYWNAHYAHEAVTAIDNALEYFGFGPAPEIQGSRYDRIAECLQKNRYLLIIDGCERLLRKGEKPGEGVSYSVTFRRLLRAFADPKSQSTVVLTSRLWPADLDQLRWEDGGRPIIRRLPVLRVEARDLVSNELFAGLPEPDLSALCSLLRGHNYGLFLAGRYLRAQEGNEERRQALRELNQQLADQLRDERLQEMVCRQMRWIDEHMGGGVVLAFLERLSLFLGAVCQETLDLCYEEACPAALSQEKRSCNVVRDRLIEAGLLFRMRPRDSGEIAEAYTVHSTAREALFRRWHGLASESLPAFGLSGFTSGRVGVDPDRARGPLIQRLFNRLIEVAELRLDRAEKAKEEGQGNAEEDARRVARGLCRDAFGLVRTRMEANTAPRWTTYDKYVQLPLAVAVLAKRAAPGFWSYCEHADAYDLAERENAPLYPAELAWLYNDIALALSASGDVLDACSFWEQAYEISRLIEHPGTGGGFHLEILLSLAFTTIESGRIPAAMRYLDDAERLLREFHDEDYAARLLGLRGLILHLRGDLQGADDLYDRCLDLLRRGSNLRAQSVFLKHRADVKISMQALEEADLLIRNSRALAESGVFPELVANARMSEGHRLARSGQAVKARLEYTAVLREARRIGFRKLEVRAMTALARLALDQKDADGARDQAMRALSIANELGLGLRQSHALVVLGLATLEAGQKDLGVAYLRRAKRLADDQEYWSRSREAENKLLELGVNPALED